VLSLVERFGATRAVEDAASCVAESALEALEMI